MNENITSLEAAENEQGYRRLIRYLRKEKEGKNKDEKTDIEEANSNKPE